MNPSQNQLLAIYLLSINYCMMNYGFLMYNLRSLAVLSIVYLPNYSEWLLTHKLRYV